MSCCKRCKRTALLLNVDSLGQRGRDSTDNVVYVPSQWEATLQCSVVFVSLAGRIHKMIPQLQGTSHPKVTLPLVKLLVYAVENREDVRTYLLPVGGTIPWTLTKVPSVNLGMGPRYGTGCNKIIKDGGYYFSKRVRPFESHSYWTLVQLGRAISQRFVNYGNWLTNGKS